MKLATFRVHTPVGPFDRFGIVELEGGPKDAAESTRARKGSVLDVNFTYAAMLADKGRPAATQAANSFCPPDVRSYAELHGTHHELLEELLHWASDKPDLKGPHGETLRYDLGAVDIRPPVTRVDVLRDFAAFEDHLENTFGKMGVSIPEEWYHAPMAFKANPTHLIGHDEPVQWPAYTEKFDYELELAAIIGAPARDVDAPKALDHVLGYTLLNDFSARDVQRGEMRNNTGPFKGKDFGWGLGPWIVTPDELTDPQHVAMKVLVNGEVWAESTPGEMKWSFAEMISYTSQDETVRVGDIIGSGTVNKGCGFEIDRWVKEGDVVELEAEGIGVLRNKILPKNKKRVAWQER